MCCSIFFFFNDTATTEIYTLSLHDALPIYLPIKAKIQVVSRHRETDSPNVVAVLPGSDPSLKSEYVVYRSEEHTSELQSQSNLVCRLLLEKKKSNTVLQPTFDEPPLRRDID